MFKVTKEFQFEAAHELPDHLGKCRRLHGHSYRLLVTFAGDRLQVEGPGRGMLIDFDELDKAVKPLIDQLDHSYLNVALEVPTAENIVEWLARHISMRMIQHSDRAKLAQVTLYETAKCSATWTPDA